MGDPERPDRLRHVPRRLQHSVDHARGEGEARALAQPPEIDEGWLCDKGRFAYTHLHAADRIVEPIMRETGRGFEAVSWDEAIEAIRGPLLSFFFGSVPCCSL